MPRRDVVQPRIERGWIEPSLADEFPDLRVLWVCAPGPTRKSPPVVRRRLEELSDLVTAPYAVSLRRRPVAEAYRVFVRQIGLDPDADQGPLEQALVNRMRRGEFRSAGLPADACLIAAIETGVSVWSLDAETLVGALGACSVQAGEALGRGPKASSVEAGRLAIADLSGPLALMFSAPDATVAPGRRTYSIVLYAIGVADVPDLVVHEALWLAGSLASEAA